MVPSLCSSFLISLSAPWLSLAVYVPNDTSLQSAVVSFLGKILN
jgi:hypothetical protein